MVGSGLLRKFSVLAAVAAVGAAACGPEDRALTAGTGGAGGDAATCAPPVAGPCDNFPQCGCAGGQNCDFKNAPGETECVASGPKGPYSVCSGIAQCQAGSTCLKNDPGAASGVCKPFCETNADCVGEGRLCQSGFGTTALKYCTLACDLADPAAACGSSLGCGQTGDASHTDCAVVGTGVGPSACNALTDCAPGYFCNKPDCVKWCRIQLGNKDCSGGRQCQDFPEQVIVGGVVYGGCVPP